MMKRLLLTLCLLIHSIATEAAQSITFDGAASKLEHTTASVCAGDTITVVYWALATGVGEGNSGYVVTLPEGGNGVSDSLTWHHTAAANTQSLYAAWSGTDGQWTWTATDNQWNGVAVSYDKSSAANVPTGRISAAGAAPGAISFSTVTTPTSTKPSPATGYCVGNVTGQNRTWAGRIAHVQIFSTILSDADKDTAIMYPSLATANRVLYLPMQGAADVNDQSGNGYNGTATSLADGSDGPPLPAGTFPQVIISRNERFLRPSFMQVENLWGLSP